MPIVIAPLVLVGVALASAIALYMYERMFGSPLEGLARAVPVVGGYIAQGIASAVDYGGKLLHEFLGTLADHLTGWLHGLSAVWNGVAQAMGDFADDVVSSLDHLTHVTVHEIVKAFVNPVRDLAQNAKDTASTALHKTEQLAIDLEKEIAGDVGVLEGKITHVLNVIENVDLPALQSVIEHGYHAGDSVLGGEIDDVKKWAGGWIDQLINDFNQIPLGQLLPLIAAVPALGALVNTIASESGLENADCRRKVKGVCGTDSSGWGQLLETIIPLFALPAIAELVVAGQELTGGLRDTIGNLH